MKPERLSVLRALYAVGLAEGTSFLVLLLIAMPLKYGANMPEAVRIVGPVHGVLFMLYVGLILPCAGLSRWKWTRIVFGLLSSVVPLGPFFFDASIKREIEALEAQVPHSSA